MFKKKIFSFLLALCLVFSACVPCVVGAVNVGGFEWINSNFASHYSGLQAIISNLQYNSNFDLSAYYCFISSYNNGTIFLLNKDFTAVSTYSGVPDYYCTDYYSIYTYQNNAIFRNSRSATIDIDDLVDYDISALTVNTSYTCDITIYTNDQYVGRVYDGNNSAPGKSYNFNQSAPIINYCLDMIYVPEIDVNPYTMVGYPVGLNLNTADFVQWIIDNDRLADLPSYIVASKLASFIDFFKNYGGSNTSFLSHVSQWFAQMNIAAQTAENKAILKQSIDKLYKEYVNSYAVTIYPSYAELPHHRRNINTVTTDDDLTLVTDLPTDTVEVTVLRDILRGLIAIPVGLHNEMKFLFDKLAQLNFDITVSNDGGQTDLSQLFLYSDEMYESDKQAFTDNISQITSVPLSNIDTINNNTLMPENMLEDKQTLSVTFPMMNGFTMNADSTDYVITTDNFTFSTAEYTNLDETVQKIKRFASILLIIAYLIYLRFAIPHIIKGD